MAVFEPDRIDQLAIGPDGGLLLAMTENRSYRDDDTATLVEDIRCKLNAYIHSVRSGNAKRLAASRGSAE